jgi:hypothetical protein
MQDMELAENSRSSTKRDGPRIYGHLMPSTHTGNMHAFHNSMGLVLGHLGALFSDNGLRHNYAYSFSPIQVMFTVF